MAAANFRLRIPLGRWSVMGLGLLVAGTLLSACNPGRRTAPGEAENQQHQRQLTEQAAQNRSRAEQFEQRRRSAAREQAARQRGWSEGHSATVACLQAERGQTDGNELRCEDQAYVEQNFRNAAGR